MIWWRPVLTSPCDFAYYHADWRLTRTSMLLWSAVIVEINSHDGANLVTCRAHRKWRQSMKWKPKSDTTRLIHASNQNILHKKSCHFRSFIIHLFVWVSSVSVFNIHGNSVNWFPGMLLFHLPQGSVYPTWIKCSDHQAALSTASTCIHLTGNSSSVMAIRREKTRAPSSRIPECMYSDVTHSRIPWRITS